MATDSEREQLLKFVPEDGSSIGNGRLRLRLGWEEAHYFEVRDRLVEAGKLGVGRGRGGSVYRATPITGARASSPTTAGIGTKYRKEKDLYKPIERYLSEVWVKNEKLQQALVEVTASQGKKKTGGQWTRPDITVVAVETYAFIPGKVIDIITFEVKPFRSWDVAGVFETASHSRFATKSYLLIHVPQGTELPPDVLDRLQKESERFGVGIGTFQDPAAADTYQFLVEPRRQTPDPFEMNEFISRQLSAKNSQRVASLIH